MNFFGMNQLRGGGFWVVATTLLLSAIAAFGQQNIPTGIVLRSAPARTAGGYADFCNYNNSVCARMQMPGTSSVLTITGVNSGVPALTLRDHASTGSEDEGLAFTDLAGTEYLRINTYGNKASYNAYDGVHYFENASVFSPTMEIENLTSGWELKLGSRTGVLQASSGYVTEISGTSSHCVKVDASSGVCDTPDPAWTSYSPTVTSSGGGTLTPVTMAAAYRVNGKSVFVRISWAGSWSAASSELQFTTPVGAKTGIVQPIYGVVSEAGVLESTYSYVEPTVIRVAKISGANFAAGANLIMTFTGVYEAN